MSESKSLPKVRTIKDVMKNLKFKETINEKQINLLLNLKHNDEQMFSIKYPSFITEASYLINKLGFDKSYNFFKTQQKQKDRIEIIRNCSEFDSSRKRLFLDTTVDLRVVRVESWVKCKKCKSRYVETETKQMRSGDEGATNFYKCKVCNYSWKD